MSPKKARKVVVSVRVHESTRDALQDCADAENREVADIMRDILSNAARDRTRKLREQGKLPQARAYTTKKL